MKRIHYNAPVILTFALVAVLVHLFSAVFSSEFTERFFVVGPSFSFGNPLDYIRLVSHVVGHASFQHLFNNLILILLLGPIMEERYGSHNMLLMIAVTALVTGVINLILFSHGLLGASGIVFMLIILVSIVDLRQDSIPLSFILVCVIFVGGELIQVFKPDNISHLSHILGGSVGALFGFGLAQREGS